MTEIAFHFNAPDKLAYACRFARKLLRMGDPRLSIAGPAAVLDQLDPMLWNMAAHDFVAHCRADSDPVVLEASPIVLLCDLSQSPHHDVLLNLWDLVPEGFEQFSKVIEIVGRDDAADRQQARARWRHYAHSGYNLIRHDLEQRGS
jgi:DNA polymerase III subunit chi